MGFMLRLLVALLAAGFVAMFLFIAKLASIDWYFNYIVVLSPLVLLLSLFGGSLFYAVLKPFHVPLSIPTCFANGAIIGALPGILLWLNHRAPPPGIEEVATYPFIFGALEPLEGSLLP
jgi:hypothetical protein